MMLVMLARLGIHTFDSRFGRTRPQGSLTGSASTEGIVGSLCFDLMMLCCCVGGSGLLGGYGCNS